MTPTGSGAKRWRRPCKTTPERVAVHCVHPHNTPFADVEAEKLIEAAHAPPSLDLKFFERGRETLCRCGPARRWPKPRRWTHAGFGQAKVEQVASNRRVLGPDGKVKIHALQFDERPARRGPIRKA